MQLILHMLKMHKMEILLTLEITAILWSKQMARGIEQQRKMHNSNCISFYWNIMKNDTSSRTTSSKVMKKETKEHASKHS